MLPRLRRALRYRVLWRTIKEPFERAHRGYSTPDTFSLDHYLAKVIAGGVAELRSREFSYPPEISSDEWNAILDKIAVGYKWYADEQFTATELAPEFYEAQALLTKWWPHLWD